MGKEWIRARGIETERKRYDFLSACLDGSLHSSVIQGRRASQLSRRFLGEAVCVSVSECILNYMHNVWH